MQQRSPIFAALIMFVPIVGILIWLFAWLLSTKNEMNQKFNTGIITGAGFGLTLTGAGGGTLASVIGTGSGTLTKSGTGKWALSGANTYSGLTTISAGVLNIQSCHGRLAQIQSDDF